MNHLHTSLKYHGPLFEHSTAMFEHMNAILVGFITGSTNVSTQIVNRYELQRATCTRSICSAFNFNNFTDRKQFSKSRKLILSESDTILVAKISNTASPLDIENALRFEWIVIDNIRYSEFPSGPLPKFIDCIVYLENKEFFLITHIFELAGTVLALGDYLKTEAIDICKIGNRISSRDYPAAISYRVHSRRTLRECISLKFVRRKCALHSNMNNEIDFLSVMPNMIEID